MQARRGDVLAEARERVERDRLLAGDGVRPTAGVGAGAAGAGNIEPLEGDGRMDEVVAEPLQASSVVGLDADGGEPRIPSAARPAVRAARSSMSSTSSTPRRATSTTST